jgi:membrane protease YdiL (CAAX protease family)
VIYSLGLWWIIWSPTEEITYQAYSLPRLQALFGRPWIALLLTAFWWGLQHCFLPLILDWDYIAWRFFAFFPGAIVALLVYSRTRRLPPLIFAHCPMDIVAAVMTLRF